MIEQDRTTAESGAAPAVEFDNVFTVRGDEPVLAGFRLRLRPGKVTVLLGPSGCGKTTVVRHLVGLLPPDSGAIVVGDRPVWDLSPSALTELRQGFGVLLGGSTVYDGSVFSSLTVFDNIAYPLRVAGVDEEVVGSRVMRQLDEFDLTKEVDLLPDALPARARRRLALAAVLVADRRLVVLDDPDSGMDQVHRDRIIRSILNAHACTGATVLITTHDVELARALGNHTAILINGRVVAEGDPAELLDGVEDGKEFDRRFRVMDYLGPPDLDSIRRAQERHGRTIVFDPILVMHLTVAAVLLAILALTAKIAPGSF